MTLRQEAFKYVLGLDLGTASVGWALVKLNQDESEVEIIRLGVRKFSDSYEKGDVPTKKNTTRNRARRDARLIRRQTLRKRDRRTGIRRILQREGLCAAGDQPFAHEKGEKYLPYRLWNEAYERQLTREEFGRVLYLLAKRRGFKSNRGAGLGKLRQREDLAQYIDLLEAEDIKKALEAEQSRLAKQASKPSKDNATKKEADDDDTAKTLVQVGHWQKCFGQTPLGKFFWALLNPQKDGQNLVELSADPEQAKLLVTNWSRQQARNKANNPLWARPDRASYEAEFDRLWTRQAPGLGLTDELKAELYDEIYFQNPLQFPQDNRAFCPYARYGDPATGEVKLVHRAPRCSMIFQEYRLRKLLADLQLTERTGAAPRHLTNEEKEEGYRVLCSRSEVSFAEFKRAIGQPRAKLEVEDRKNAGADYPNKAIRGHGVNPVFERVTGDHPSTAEIQGLWAAPERYMRPDLRQEMRAKGKVTRERARTHLVRLIGEASFTRVDRLVQPCPKASAERMVHLLQTDFELSNIAAFRIAELRLPEGMASLSYTAMAKLLPHLRKGKMEHEALMIEYGYGSLPGERKLLRSIDKPATMRTILSPRVRKSLNQARKVINTLLAEHPEVELSEIRVETARRMKENNERYAESLATQEYNYRMNQEALAFWNENGGTSRPPGDFALRYRLWLEQNRKCGYTASGNPCISVEQLMDGKELEVDHILTREGGGDGFGNKVLVFRTANQVKGKRLPWEMSAEWRDDVRRNSEQWAIFQTKKPPTEQDKADKKTAFKPTKTAIGIAERKVKLLTLEQPIELRKNDFAEAQLVETGYIAREAIDFFQPVAEKVTAVRSTFSTTVAKAFGFYKALDKVHVADLDRVAKNQKDRILMRHHAADALAVALCSVKTVQHISQQERLPSGLAAMRKELQQLRPEWTVPEHEDAVRRSLVTARLQRFQPKGVFAQLRVALADLVVSHEQKHVPSGKLFHEQPHGVRKKKPLDQAKREGANKREWVENLSLAQIFTPGAKEPAPTDVFDLEGEEEAEGGKVRGGKIASEKTRRRIADFLTANGIGPGTSKKTFEEFLKGLKNGVPYSSHGHTRYIRQVMLTVPVDRLDNYYVREQDGGHMLYKKNERHCAVIGLCDGRPFMETVPLADAAAVAGPLPPKARKANRDGGRFGGLTEGQYRSAMIQTACHRAGISPDQLTDVLVVHKQDMVQVRERGAEEWDEAVYRVETLDGGGKRLWIRSHWSADRATKVSEQVGHKISSISKTEFRLVKVDSLGSAEVGV